jgi:hypothetical protein
MDSSRELAFIWAMDFITNLYLIFLNDVQKFDVTELKFSLEKQTAPKPQDNKQALSRKTFLSKAKLLTRQQPL